MQVFADSGTGQVVAPTVDAMGTTVVELHGEIDRAVVEPLRDCVLSSIERDADVLVDLADVSLIDFSSLSFLVQAAQVADRRGRRLCLVAVSPIVQRTLAAAGLDRTLAIPRAAVDRSGSRRSGSGWQHPMG